MLYAVGHEVGRPFNPYSICPVQSSVYHARQCEALASRSVQSHYSVLAATVGKVPVDIQLMVKIKATQANHRC